jgi:hypothetical protein
MVQTPIKPQISERQEVINWLVANNYPALPVAPCCGSRAVPSTREERGNQAR